MLAGDGEIAVDGVYGELAQVTAPVDVVVLVASNGDWEWEGDGALVLVLEEPKPLQYAGAIRDGARAVLSLDVTPEELRAAVHAAAAGLVTVPAAQAMALVGAAVETPRQGLAETLTPRETEILRLLATGIANKEIAARLAISEHTVKAHIASVLGKLHAGSRTEAVSIGLRQGLILL
ncbi:MAG: response regulator transcription factor [Bryobacterales bacterium]|nr:response regulator transcription factor [Bryobacterales bacterium]